MWKSQISLLVGSIFFILPWLSGCAPSFGNAIRFPEVPAERSLGLSSLSNGQLAIGVDEVVDARKIPWIVRISEGRVIKPEGEPGEVVGEALRTLVRESGIILDPNAPVSVAGEVLDWRALVSIGFPVSRADCEGLLKLYLLDNTDRLLFSGTYHGISSVEDLSIESKVDECLSNAMGYAIREAFLDPKFLERIIHKGP